MATNALDIITAPSEYPVSLAQAKAHLRITHSFDNDLIQNHIIAASNWAEDQTRRILMKTVVESFRHKFPTRVFDLPGGKVTAVEEIRYTDGDGNPQTLNGPTSAAPGTDYQENLKSDEMPWLYPAQDSNWPDVQLDLVNAVAVQYTVGYGDSPEDVPFSIRQAIFFKIGDMYSIRDSNDAGGKQPSTSAEMLIHPYVLNLA